MKIHFATVLLVAACGSSSNNPPAGDGPGSGSGQHDAKVYMDAPPNVPAMITISGTATQQTTNGGTPVAGVAIGAYKTSDPSTAVATATSDAMGKFSMTITTGGVPLDGYIKATKSGNVDTYLFPPAPLIADFSMASVNELDTNTYSLLEDTLGGGQTGQGAIVLEVTDSTGATVGGAAVTATPASTKTGYTMGTSPIPSFTATMTASDGRAYLTGNNAGSVSVSATKTGVTFKTHSVTVFSGAFTTTIITE